MGHVREMNLTFAVEKAAQGDKSMKVDLDGIAMGGIKINGLDA